MIPSIVMINSVEFHFELLLTGTISSHFIHIPKISILPPETISTEGLSSLGFLYFTYEPQIIIPSLSPGVYLTTCPGKTG